jgi:hypothetical protein
MVRLSCRYIQTLGLAAAGPASARACRTAAA